MGDNYSDPVVKEQAFYHELSMSHDHQHLVTLKGFCPTQRALVYEFMDGGNLEQLLKTGRLPHMFGVDVRVTWLLHVASGLAFLHTGFPQPIRHWDIKPHNILLDQSMSCAKVADMGLSRPILCISESAPSS